MRVKVGPITATYQGKLRFLELDEQGRRAVMRARAEEASGQGNAEARITTAIEDADDGGSLIRMDTDLQMRGRVAQFGRGAMEKISERMFAEFARNLERELTGEAPAARRRRPPTPRDHAGAAEAPDGREAATAGERPRRAARGRRRPAADALGMFAHRRAGSSGPARPRPGAHRLRLRLPARTAARAAEVSTTDRAPPPARPPRSPRDRTAALGRGAGRARPGAGGP